MENYPPPNSVRPESSDARNVREYRKGDRHDVAIQGRYRTGIGVPKDIEILDISETGCRFKDRFGRLDIGAQITVRVGPIGPITATVRWTVNHIVGVQFNDPLYGPVFEHIRLQLDQRHEEKAQQKLY